MPRFNPEDVMPDSQDSNDQGSQNQQDDNGTVFSRFGDWVKSQYYNMKNISSGNERDDIASRLTNGDFTGDEEREALKQRYNDLSLEIDSNAQKEQELDDKMDSQNNYWKKALGSQWGGTIRSGIAQGIGIALDPITGGLGTPIASAWGGYDDNNSNATEARHKVLLEGGTPQEAEAAYDDASIKGIPLSMADAAAMYYGGNLVKKGVMGTKVGKLITNKLGDSLFGKALSTTGETIGKLANADIPSQVATRVALGTGHPIVGRIAGALTSAEISREFEPRQEVAQNWATDLAVNNQRQNYAPDLYDPSLSGFVNSIKNYDWNSPENVETYDQAQKSGQAMGLIAGLIGSRANLKKGTFSRENIQFGTNIEKFLNDENNDFVISKDGLQNIQDQIAPVIGVTPEEAHKWSVPETARIGREVYGNILGGKEGATAESYTKAENELINHIVDGQEQSAPSLMSKASSEFFKLYKRDTVNAGIYNPTERQQQEQNTQQQTTQQEEQKQQTTSTSNTDQEAVAQQTQDKLNKESSTNYNEELDNKTKIQKSRVAELERQEFNARNGGLVQRADEIGKRLQIERAKLQNLEHLNSGNIQQFKAKSVHGIFTNETADQAKEREANENTSISSEPDEVQENNTGYAQNIGSWTKTTGSNPTEFTADDGDGTVTTKGQVYQNPKGESVLVTKNDDGTVDIGLVDGKATQVFDNEQKAKEWLESGESPNYSEQGKNNNTVGGNAPEKISGVKVHSLKELQDYYYKYQNTDMALTPMQYFYLSDMLMRTKSVNPVLDLALNQKAVNPITGNQVFGREQTIVEGNLNKAILSLYKGADVVTAVHEFAHAGWALMSNEEKTIFSKYAIGSEADFICKVFGIDNTEENKAKVMQGKNGEFKGRFNENAIARQTFDLMNKNMSNEVRKLAVEERFCHEFSLWYVDGMVNGGTPSAITNIYMAVARTLSKGLRKLGFTAEWCKSKGYEKLKLQISPLTMYENINKVNANTNQGNNFNIGQPTQSVRTEENQNIKLLPRPNDFIAGSNGVQQVQRGTIPPKTNGVQQEINKDIKENKETEKQNEQLKVAQEKELAKKKAEIEKDIIRKKKEVAKQEKEKAKAQAKAQKLAKEIKKISPEKQQQVKEQLTKVAQDQTNPNSKMAQEYMKQEAQKTAPTTTQEESVKQAPQQTESEDTYYIEDSNGNMVPVHVGTQQPTVAKTNKQVSQKKVKKVSATAGQKISTSSIIKVNNNVNKEVNNGTTEEQRGTKDIRGTSKGIQEQQENSQNDSEGQKRQVGQEGLENNPRANARPALTKKNGGYKQSTKEELNNLKTFNGDNAYEDAKAYRDELLKNGKMPEKQINKENKETTVSNPKQEEVALSNTQKETEPQEKTFTCYVKDRETGKKKIIETKAKSKTQVMEDLAGNGYVAYKVAEKDWYDAYSKYSKGDNDWDFSALKYFKDKPPQSQEEWDNAVERLSKELDERHKKNDIKREEKNKQHEQEFKQQREQSIKDDIDRLEKLSKEKRLSALETMRDSIEKNGNDSYTEDINTVLNHFKDEVSELDNKEEVKTEQKQKKKEQKESYTTSGIRTIEQVKQEGWHKINPRQYEGAYFTKEEVEEARKIYDEKLNNKVGIKFITDLPKEKINEIKEDYKKLLYKALINKDTVSERLALDAMDDYLYDFNHSVTGTTESFISNTANSTGNGYTTPYSNYFITEGVRNPILKKSEYNAIVKQVNAEKIANETERINKLSKEDRTTELQKYIKLGKDTENEESKIALGVLKNFKKEINELSNPKNTIKSTPKKTKVAPKVVKAELKVEKVVEQPKTKPVVKETKQTTTTDEENLDRILDEKKPKAPILEPDYPISKTSQKEIRSDFEKNDLKDFLDSTTSELKEFKKQADDNVKELGSQLDRANKDLEKLKKKSEETTNKLAKEKINEKLEEAKEKQNNIKESHYQYKLQQKTLGLLLGEPEEHISKYSEQGNVTEDMSDENYKSTIDKFKDTWRVQFDKKATEWSKNKKIINELKNSKDWRTIKYDSGAMAFERKNTESHHTKIITYSDLNGKKESLNKNGYRKIIANGIVDVLFNDQNPVYQMAKESGLTRAYMKYMVEREQGSVGATAIDKGILLPNGERTVSLQDIYYNVGESNMTDFDNYVIAKHIVDLSKAERTTTVTVDGKKQKKTIIGYQQTMTLEEANKLIKEVEDGKNGNLFKAEQKHLVEYNQALLDVLVNGKFITKETASMLKSKYPNYVPLEKDVDDIGQYLTNLAMGKRVVNIKNPLRKIGDSTREILSPMGVTAKHTLKFYNDTTHNLAGLTFIDEISKAISIDEKGNKVRLNGSLCTELVGKDLKVDAKKHIFFVNDIVKDKKTGKDKAVKRFFQVGDEQIYNAIVTLPEPQLNKALQCGAWLVKAPARIIRFGATNSLDFVKRNVIRDNVEAFISTEHGFLPILDWGWGVKQILQDTNWWKEYQSMNGELGTLTRDEKGLPQLGRKQKITDLWNVFTNANGNQSKVNRLKAFGKLFIKPITTAYHGLEYVNNLGELGTRVGEYKNARMGYHGTWGRLTSGTAFNPDMSKAINDKFYAAYKAKEITLDFGQHGSLGKYANKVVPFFNASLQGTYKTFGLMKEFATTKDKTRKFELGMKMGLTALGAAMLFAYGHGHRDYDEAPDYEWQNYWIFPDGVREPKDQCFGTNIGTTVEMALRQIAKDGKVDIPKLMGSLVGAFAPNDCFPAIINLIMGAKSNYDYFKKQQIVPDYMKNLPVNKQVDINTTHLAKDMSYFLDNYLGFEVSPKRIDWALQSTLSNCNKWIQSCYDLGRENATGEKNDKMARGGEMGFLKDDVPRPLNIITGTSVTNNTSFQSVTDFHEKFAELSSKMDSTSEKNPTVQKDTKGNPKIDIREWKLYHDANKQIMLLNKQIKEIKQDPKLDGKEKRAEADPLFDKQIKIAKYTKEKAKKYEK